MESFKILQLSSSEATLLASQHFSTEEGILVIYGIIHYMPFEGFCFFFKGGEIVQS